MTEDKEDQLVNYRPPVGFDNAGTRTMFSVVIAGGDNEKNRNPIHHQIATLRTYRIFGSSH